MLKLMKKSKVIIIMSLFFVILCSNSYARFGRRGSSGLGKILKILVAMQTKQALMSDTQIQQYMTEIKQLEQDIKQLEKQTQILDIEKINVKELDKNWKKGEIDKILNTANKIEHYKNVSLNDLRRRATILENISKYFSLNQKEFENAEPITREEIKKTEKRIEMMRDEVKQTTAKINQKSRNGYTKKDEDLKTLKEKLEKVNDAKGQLEVLQAIGASISQTNELLIDLKEIERDQTNLIANLAQKEATEEDQKTANYQRVLKETEEKSKKQEKELKNFFNNNNKLSI